MNSRRKGAHGELQWAAKLREEGFDARRGRQFHGGDDSPDVVSDALPWVHWEVKLTEALRLSEAVAQATRDAGERKVPIVVHRRNRSPWLVTMRADDLFRILRSCDLEELARP